MMEIKFRCWDKQEKVMGHVTRLDENEYVEFELTNPIKSCLHCCGKDCWHPHKYIRDDIELMQYTGLKDKNGVEIYEGDFIEVDGWIAWCDKCASFEFFTPFGCASCDGDVHWFEVVQDGQIEVIGNVYENPELKEGL